MNCFLTTRLEFLFYSISLLGTLCALLHFSLRKVLFFLRVIPKRLRA
jgi:hypothetical protein